MRRQIPSAVARAAAGLVCATAIVVGVAWAEGPSFDCSAVEPGSIGALICDDAELSAIDRTMAEVYAAASAKAVNERPPVLKVEQRGWIKGRDDCWKNDDVRGCVGQAYRLRVAELQAQYRLVPERGPVTYVCDGQPANQVIATFFDTDPPTLIAERGDQVSLMFLQAAASGSKYEGRNEMLWEHHGEAVITWGFDSPKMHCAVSGPDP